MAWNPLKVGLPSACSSEFPEALDQEAEVDSLVGSPTLQQRCMPCLIIDETDPLLGQDRCQCCCHYDLGVYLQEVDERLTSRQSLQQGRWQ